MLDYLLMALGVACAAAGGDLFVRGTIGIARSMRISGAIIGATVTAFATSSPEFAVAVTAATRGTPQIALGDAMGSNVVNVALILGLALLIAPMKVKPGNLNREFSTALTAPLLTGLVCLDGMITRVEAALLLAVFAGWLALVVREARRQRAAGNVANGTVPSSWPAIAATIGGLLLLSVAGQLIVVSARAIAAAHGITDFLIGATIVAFGTSVPELATALIARWRGRDDIGLGTILGSNIFNGLWIVPWAALIHPIATDAVAVGIALSFGVLVMLVAFPPSDGTIGRGRGTLLLIAYAAYVSALTLY